MRQTKTRKRPQGQPSPVQSAFNPLAASVTMPGPNFGASLASGDWLLFADMEAFHVDQSLEGLAIPLRQKGFKARKCLSPFPKR